MSLQTHPAIPLYQSTLAQLKAQGHVTEAQTRRAFGRLLERICEERGFLFVEEYPVGKNGRKKVDGAIRDNYSSLGYWEAKDEKDALEIEIKKKIALDYPINNTIFEDTQRACLWQNNKQVGEFNLARGEEVGAMLDRFFGYTEADREGFEAAVAAFIARVPELARALLQKINDERDNARFKTAFDSFFAVCQSALNPNIKAEAVKEMLVQHLLTERLFKHVFQNDEWFAHNIIAREIDAVIHALTSSKWNRADFLKSLDPFFKPIEDRARTLPDYSEKQAFRGALYERFFQGYSLETADTMGIVTTPQPIVDWMCASVERTLQTQGAKRPITRGSAIYRKI